MPAAGSVVEVRQLRQALAEARSIADELGAALGALLKIDQLATKLALQATTIHAADEALARYAKEPWAATWEPPHA